MGLWIIEHIDWTVSTQWVDSHILHRRLHRKVGHFFLLSTSQLKILWDFSHSIPNDWFKDCAFITLSYLRHSRLCLTLLRSADLDFFLLWCHSTLLMWDPFGVGEYLKNANESQWNDDPGCRVNEFKWSRHCRCLLNIIMSAEEAKTVHKTNEPFHFVFKSIRWLWCGKYCKSIFLCSIASIPASLSLCLSFCGSLPHTICIVSVTAFVLIY